jgi:cysteinyl-tRNA synthetase
LLFAQEVFTELCGVLNIASQGKDNTIDAEIEQLIQKRQEARKQKDFKTADEIRDILKQRGIILLDTKDGVKWKYEG